ncbi:8880_t:CDS:2, partial [Funneliformis caledonium]
MVNTDAGALMISDIQISMKIRLQKSNSVGSYYIKLKKIARYINIGDDEFYHKFLERLSSDNQME